MYVCIHIHIMSMLIHVCHIFVSIHSRYMSTIHVDMGFDECIHTSFHQAHSKPVYKRCVGLQRTSFSTDSRKVQIP